MQNCLFCAATLRQLCETLRVNKKASGPFKSTFLCRHLYPHICSYLNVNYVLRPYTNYKISMEFFFFGGGGGGQKICLAPKVLNK